MLACKTRASEGGGLLAGAVCNRQVQQPIGQGTHLAAHVGMTPAWLDGASQGATSWAALPGLQALEDILLAAWPWQRAASGSPPYPPLAE